MAIIYEMRHLQFKIGDFFLLSGEVQFLLHNIRHIFLCGYKIVLLVRHDLCLLYQKWITRNESLGFIFFFANYLSNFLARLQSLILFYLNNQLKTISVIIENCLHISICRNKKIYIYLKINMAQLSTSYKHKQTH